MLFFIKFSAVLIFFKCLMTLSVYLKFTTCDIHQFIVILSVTFTKGGDLGGSSCLHGSTPWDHGWRKKKADDRGLYIRFVRKELSSNLSSSCHKTELLCIPGQG